MSSHTYWHNSKVTTSARERLSGHRAACVWLTGLSGSGKSTLAVELEKRLYESSVRTYILDGDNIRRGLNQDLGFSDDDRRENIRRISEVAKLFVDAGIVVIAAFISPFRQARLNARSLFEPGKFIEVYVDCDLETCRRRDPKGLYARAEQGTIKNFTGISSGYEPPQNPELTLSNNDEAKIDSNVDSVLQYLQDTGIVPCKIP